MRKLICGILSVSAKCLMAAALVACPALAQDQAPKLQAPEAGQQQAGQSQQPASQPPTQASGSASEGQNPPKPAQPSPGGEDQDKEKGSTTNSSGTSKDRMFFALPNYLTIENPNQLPPLTAGQKFKTVARGAFDPVELGYFGVLAGFSQAANSEPGYGQGAEGYAKRYGAAFGDSTIENFMVGAAMPSLLRTDPRYYQRGKGGFAKRATYAISRLFVTRTDSGHATFNFSEVFGSGIAASISTYSYHPSGDRTVSNTASVWGTQVGQDAFTYMLKEFWPDIRRMFKKK